MKRALVVLLFACVVFLAGQSVRSTGFTTGTHKAARGLPEVESKRELTLSDISKFEWVDKRCRMWAHDGDLDVDQTCLVVKTVRGGTVVFPNEYNEVWLKEITDRKASEDKWIQRFFAIGGGAKLR